jgi:hypothetical protein
VAKTRRGSRKTSASRAKGARKSATKGTKKSASPKSKASSQRKQIAPTGLDLKKLRSDILKANDALQKRMQGVDPVSEKGKKLADTQLAITRWQADIDSICSNDPNSEPCGTTMVIS